ncbi:MAG: WG repeat-containing protein [Deltaproteobacteria bacterium]|nr:WG repeat-containing protein [Deltaproteobacteria bacterium]
MKERSLSREGKFGIINLSGSKIAEAVYDEIRDYKNGYAIAKNGNNVGLLDKEGKVALDFVYDDIVGMKNNYVTFRAGGKYGVLDIKSKNMVIEPLFDLLSVLQEGYAVFCNGNCIRCDSILCSIDSRFSDFGREMYIGDEVGYVNLKKEIFAMKDVNVASVFSNQRAVLCQWKDRYTKNDCYIND